MEPYVNGFFSYLMENQLQCEDIEMEDALRQGAQSWNALSCREKSRYRSRVRYN